MPRFKTDDQIIAQPESFDRVFMNRLTATAQHPSARKPPVFEDTRSSYRQMEAPVGAVWPRASIRPMPLLRGKQWWAVQVWESPGVKALVESEDGFPVPTGLWLSSNFATLPEAVDWAAAQVERRRPKDQGSVPWGAAV